MKGNSNSKKTTEEKKNEKKMTNADLMQFLGKYDSIIKDKMISDNAKKVLSCLLYVGSKQNESFTIGQRTISELTGVPKNKISANIAILVDKGFINCNVGERGKNSEYTINYETMKSYVSISVPSVPNNEGTVKRTVEGTPKDAEIQRVMERIEVYQKCINEELGTLKKMLFGDININININNNINLKDNILNNDNTEGYNIKDQEKKKNISTGNLEKLKENSTVEIPNDEDIQRENESLDESRIPSESRIETRDNISTDNISNNENLNESRISDLVDMYFNQTNIPNDNIPSESRIPSEDNISTDENPNDMPPLDVDCFFENNYNQYTEYRDNENLNESRIPSEDGRIETRDNISTDNISDNENSKADEIDCSVFGNETFDSDTISKTQNLVPRCVDGRFVVVEDNSKANNISNDNNSSENMKKTKISKGEISNKSNISNKGKISKKANSSNSFIHFGRLVGVCDMKGNVEEYLFNAYDTLKTADDFSEKFTETTEITIDLTQLEVSQDCGSGVWGMLSFNNGEYSFTQSNVNTQYSEKVTQSCAAETAETSNNVPQGDEIAEVDNYTTEGEKVDSTQSQIANKASEGNNETTADSKEDEKATEMPNADEKNTEVDSNTTNEEKTAGNSVKMRPEASDEKIDTTAEWNNIELFIITSYRTVRSLIEELGEIPVTNLESFSLAYSPLDYQMTHEYKQTMTSDEWNSFANTLKNVTDRFFRHWAEVFSTRQPSSNFYEQQMYGLVQNNHQQSTATVNDTSNNGIQASISSKVDNYTTEGEKVAPVQSTIANKASENNAAPLPNSIKAWEKVNIYSHIDKKTYTMNEGFEIYKALSAKDIHSLMTWMKDFCDTMRMAKDNNIITEEQFNDFHNVFNALSRGKKKYWYNAFSNREPRKTMTSEMQMWEYLGKPKVNKADNKTVDNNKVYEDNVILPTDKDFESMSLDDIKNHLLTFVQEHPNLSDDKKAYINNLCIAYTIEPQYVA